MESVFLTSFAGYFGLVAGIGLLEAVSTSLPDGNNSMFSNASVDLEVALKALTVLVISGALADVFDSCKTGSFH